MCEVYLAEDDLGTRTAPDVLEVPGESLAGPRLAADDTQLFFLRSMTDGDIWLMRFEKTDAIDALYGLIARNR